MGDCSETKLNINPQTCGLTSESLNAPRLSCRSSAAAWFLTSNSYTLRLPYTYTHTIYQLKYTVYIHTHISIDTTWFLTHFNVFFIQFHVLVHSLQNLHLEPAELDQDQQTDSKAGDRLWIQTDKKTWTFNLPHPPLQPSTSAGSLISESTHHLRNKQIHSLNNNYEYILNKCRNGRIGFCKQC